MQTFLPSTKGTCNPLTMFDGKCSECQVYAELKGHIPSFLKLYQLTKQEGLGPEQVVDALKIVRKLPHLEAEYDQVRGKVFVIKRQQEKLENELYQLNRYKEISDNQLESLRKEENKLRHLIDRLENSKEYLNLNKVAQKRVREILHNKRLVIGIALSTLITAIRNEPDRRLLNYLLNGEMDTSTSQYYRQKIIEVAQKCYQQLVNDCVDGILNSIPFEPEVQKLALLKSNQVLYSGDKKGAEATWFAS